MGRAVARVRGRVLVVEDEPAIRFGIVAALRAAGHDVVEAATCEDAANNFRGVTPDAVVSDLRLPDGNAVDMIPRLNAMDASVPIYIVTGYGTIDVAVAAVKRGAEEFLTKPVDMPRLVSLVGSAIERRLLKPAPQRSGVHAAVRSTSEQVRRLEDQVERLRDADCSVLILGETGTGKSVLARKIHEIGARAGRPFVDVNCAGLTRELVESELFGHERGAFTGAHAVKSGLLDSAHGGTLFLDEIGDIDVMVQPKILKAVEEKRFRRMGDVREREVDVRLIAATHHELLGAVARHTFRADLYYRISTVTLTLPPLRERTGDILPIARAFVFGRIGEEVDFDEEASRKLLEHPWRGNIRELKNVLERALLLREARHIRGVDIRFDGAPGVSQTMPVGTHETPSASRLLASDAGSATRAEIEREHIQLALAATGGRVEAAAKRLGLSRSTLYQKLKSYGIAISRPRIAREDKPGGDD